MKLLYRLPLLVLAAWFAGFVAYWQVVLHYESDTQTPCDALVVLTGSNGRIERGMELFEKGRAPVMLITGVGDDRHSEVFLASYQPSPALKHKFDVPGALSIDRKAENTYGNAEQTLLWLRDKDFQSLCLVTAHYHMPRSLFVYRNLMPDKRWIPEVVHGNDVLPDQTFKRQVIFRIMMLEYHKLIASWLIEHLS